MRSLAFSQITNSAIDDVCLSGFYKHEIITSISLFSSIAHQYLGWDGWIAGMVINSETTKVGSAIDRAFSIIGEESKRKLIIHLRKTYQLDIYSPQLDASAAIEKLEPALGEIFSIGSSLIMQLVVAEIKKYS